MILSLAVLVSKLLGFLYVIPLEHLIGLQGLALLNHGYTPYTVLLSLTTLGIPLAVSKYVATQNQLGNYRQGVRLLKHSFYLLLGVGVLMYFFVFLAAPAFARFLHSPESTWIIRASTSALVIVPAMAVLRGYFQGWQSMGPTGVSQVIEQFVRVVFFVLVAYFCVQMGFTLESTVAIASLGTLLGAIAATITMVFYWYKRRGGIHQKVLSSPKVEPKPLYQEYAALLRYAVPISFVSLAIPLFSLIDLVLFKPLLYAMGYSKEVAINWFGILSSTAQKLIMLPVSLATALSLSILPALTRAHVQGSRREIRQQAEQSFLLLLYVVAPASVGIYILAEPLYTTLFSDGSGVAMLQAYTPAIIMISLYTLSATILQAIGKTQWSIWGLGLTLLIKIVAMVLFMLFINPELGAIHATTMAFFTGSILNIYGVLRSYDVAKKNLLIGGGKIFVAALIMGAGVYLFAKLWQLAVPEQTLVYSSVYLVLAVSLGALIYYLLTRKFPWVQAMLSRRKLSK